VEGYILLLAIVFVAGAVLMARLLTGKWFVFKN